MFYTIYVPLFENVYEIVCFTWDNHIHVRGYYTVGM